MQCEICHGIGNHLYGCPNYEPEKVATCALCGEPIFSDESIYDVDGEKYHIECFAEKYEVRA